MFVLKDPFFWAFISVYGLLAGSALISGTRLKKYTPLGFIIVTISDLARVILVLPVCPQPRLMIGNWNWIAGGVILAAALVFATPAFSIKWWAAPDEKTVLKTTGIYGLVRNPIYLADILFALGFAMMFRSIIGIALVPLWWAGFLFLVLIEEESLARALGQPYLEYKQRVKGRILPGLPI
ncbi:MAG: isoprenylcysteine carboxylmethyltransferase family protein [Candidatus Neomarinimicrobiota bacterium]